MQSSTIVGAMVGGGTTLQLLAMQRYSDGQERCSSQRCYGASRQRAAACNVVAATCWTSQRCCNVRQRTAILANVALQRFFFFLNFLFDNLKRKKNGRKREVLTLAL